MGQQGGSRLRLLIALLIVVSLVILAVQVIPVYVRSYEFEDAMRNQAKFAGVNRKPPEVIHKELYEKARALELPVDPRDIRVQPQPGGVRIQAQYSVQVDLVVYQPYLDFDFTADTRTTY